MNTINVNFRDTVSAVEVEDSISLLEAVRSVKDIYIDALCGGKGTCGKCKIKILKGEQSGPTEKEMEFLSDREKLHGYRLACMIDVTGDMDVLVDDFHDKSQILTSHHGFTGELSPFIHKKYLRLSLPSLDDQRDDLSRILESIPLNNAFVSLPLRKKIPNLLKESEYKVTVVYSSDTLISVEPGNTESSNYGIAIDIGTTTVAAYLLDIRTGKIIDTVSGLNSQKNFGADVISRIEFSMQGPEKLKMLQDKIVSQIGNMCISLEVKSGISKNSIYSIILAGNTTMLHLVFGIDPSGIAAAPFIPGFLQVMNISSTELGNFPLDCIIYSLPSISGYVGADIVAGILATRMHEREELSLLIDIGTNGEIVFGNREQLYACSTAAGPAFEGAHISCGIGGINGAVDGAVIENNLIKLSTIGNEKATGICGSGIIDIVAVLLKSGFVDFTGRIQNEDEVDDSTAVLLKKLKTDKNGSAFVIAEKSKTGTGEDVIFTQADIREVQLAKAAISAGIFSLLNKAGRDADEIAHVFIAGGFGSYISIKSAAEIGLIPSKLLDKTESVGNTAGLGALSCALSEENFNKAREIAKITEYVELSSDSFFNMKYMEEMVFPEY